MKPKTKIQFRIMELSKKLPKLKAAHTKWAEKLHDKYVTKHYSKLICLECNHSWKDELPDWTVKVLNHVCPNCKSELVPISNNTSFSQFETFALIDVVEEFQVIRYFSVWKHMRKKEVPRYFVQELFQEFDDFQLGTNKKTKLIIVGLSFSQSGGWHDDGFSYGSSFDIKNPYDSYKRYRYTIRLSAIYPEIKVLPQIQRNGFENDFHSVYPRTLFSAILNNTIAETFLKLKNTELLSYYLCKRDISINKYWNQIKICLRNGYEIKDISMWIDYINFLEYFDKDINNPKFICPDNLHTAHNEYMLKKEAEMERLRILSQLEKEKEEEANKAKNLIVVKTKKKCFKDFSLTDREIKYVPLITVQDFKKEGKALFHCVYSSEYHKKTYSLLLSARINGVPIETIEISLKSFSLLQSRGYDNKPTDKHDRIVKFIEKNLSKIKRIFEKELHAALNPNKKQDVTKKRINRKNQQLPIAV